MTAPPLTDEIRAALLPLVGKNASERRREDTWAFVWDQRGMSAASFMDKYRPAIRLAQRLAKA